MPIARPTNFSIDEWSQGNNPTHASLASSSYCFHCTGLDGAHVEEPAPRM